MSLSLSSILFIVLLWNVDIVFGHGRMLEPPMRSSAWRYGFPTPKNYNDNELNCGGFANQMANGGRCAPCGDRWQGPRDNEAGGKYATGTIVREYASGQIINTTIEVTSNHKGYFEFRLCPNNNPHRAVTQACLDRYVLKILGYGQRYVIKAPDVRVFIELQISLPPGITCTQCVLQWRWRAAQNRGPDGKGGECFGCGPQEHFINCADIAIAGGSKKPLPLNRPTISHKAHIYTSQKSPSSVIPTDYNNAVLQPKKSMDIPIPTYTDPNTANYNDYTYYQMNQQNAISNSVTQPTYSLFNADQYDTGYYRQSANTGPVVNNNGLTPTKQYNNGITTTKQHQISTPPAKQQSFTSTNQHNQNSDQVLIDNALLSYTSSLTSENSESAMIECQDGYSPICKASSVFSKMKAFDKWCSSICPTNLCPSSVCTCTCPVTTHRPHPQHQPQQQHVIQCRGTPGWSDPYIDRMCQRNCQQYDNCPSEICTCNEY